MMYSIGVGGLKLLTTTGKNDLEKGQITEWRGNYEHKNVIVENLGIDNKNPSYGTKYQTINLNSNELRLLHAYELVYPDDPNLWHTQHNYILDEKYPIDKVDALFKATIEKKLKEQTIQKKMRIERERLIETGKELFKKYIPTTAKAVIVAESEIDDCDITTDHFNTKTNGLIILGYSSHKRDIFSDHRYDTGWKISKCNKWNENWDESLYISIATKCIFK